MTKISHNTSQPNIGGLGTPTSFHNLSPGLPRSLRTLLLSLAQDAAGQVSIFWILPWVSYFFSCVHRWLNMVFLLITYLRLLQFIYHPSPWEGRVKCRCAHCSEETTKGIQCFWSALCKAQGKKAPLVTLWRPQDCSAVSLPHLSCSLPLGLWTWNCMVCRFNTFEVYKPRLTNNALVSC